MSGDIDFVMIRSAVVENVGIRWNYVCMLLETEVTATNRKPPIFPWRVPFVFQVAPDTGKSCRHAENVRTSRIGCVLAKKTGLGPGSLKTPSGSEG